MPLLDSFSSVTALKLNIFHNGSVVAKTAPHVDHVKHQYGNDGRFALTIAAFFIFILLPHYSEALLPAMKKNIIHECMEEMKGAMAKRLFMPEDKCIFSTCLVPCPHGE